MPRGGPRPVCSLHDCDRPHKAKGYCELHFMRWKRHGDPYFVHRNHPPKECEVRGCDKPQYAKGLCNMHWRGALRRGFDPREPVTCYICGKVWHNWPLGKHLSIDRVIPRAQGGKYTKDNMKVCCFRCNRQKQDLTYDELIEWCRKVVKYEHNTR